MTGIKKVKIPALCQAKTATKLCRLVSKNNHIRKEFYDVNPSIVKVFKKDFKPFKPDKFLKLIRFRYCLKLSNSAHGHIKMGHELDNYSTLNFCATK